VKTGTANGIDAGVSSRDTTYSMMQAVNVTLTSPWARPTITILPISITTTRVPIINIM